MNIKKQILNLEKRIFKTYIFIDKTGLWFYYRGDEVGWIYPWKRKDKKYKWISLNFSGNGEFGDACFKSLKEIDKEWDKYNETIKKNAKKYRR
jgi:hypothetical protein